MYQGIHAVSDSRVSRALEHARYLSDVIGARPSAGASEYAAHDYVRRQLEAIGCETRVDEFCAPHSAYRPYLVAFGGLIGLASAFWVCETTSGIVSLSGVAFILVGSLLLEMTGMANPVRWLVRRGRSRNVIGITRARTVPLRRISILAHVDSHRTSWIWRSRGHFHVYLVLSTWSCIAACSLPIMMLLALAKPDGPWRECVLFGYSAVALMWLLHLEADTTPFSAGANDNASGV